MNYNLLTPTTITPSQSPYWMKVTQWWSLTSILCGSLRQAKYPLLLCDKVFRLFVYGPKYFCSRKTTKGSIKNTMNMTEITTSTHLTINEHGQDMKEHDSVTYNFTLDEPQDGLLVQKPMGIHEINNVSVDGLRLGSDEWIATRIVGSDRLYVEIKGVLEKGSHKIRITGKDTVYIVEGETK